MIPRLHNPRTEEVLDGRYQILEDLGSGRDGAVYLAYDPVHATTVAIKWVSTAEARQQGALFREYEIGTRLNHPNWPQVLDYGRVDSIEYFTMEHVDGVPLDEALPNLSRLQALELLGQACAALTALHAQRAIHADLNPKHLLVVGSGSEWRLKLLDLSLAVDLVGADPGPPSEKLVRGSLEFASPSVLAGNAPTQVDDLYALGACFERSLAGRAQGDLEGDPTQALTAVLARLTSEDPDTRYHSARHASRDLARSKGPGIQGEQQEPVPLLGREAELDLCDQLAETFSSEARGMRTWFSGAPGMGRSRLLAEARRRLRVRGLSTVTVASLAAPEWSRVLRELRMGHGRCSPALASALDALERTADNAGPWTGEEAAEALRLAALVRPLVVVIDADGNPDGEALGRALLALPASVPLWLLVRASAAAPQAVRGCATTTIWMKPLSRELSTQLCREFLPECDAWIEHRIYEHCDGHPAFTVAAAQRVAGALDPSNLSKDALDALIHATIPDSVAAHLRRRLHDQPAEARDLARQLAVFSNGMRETVLAPFASFLSPDALRAALGCLADAGLLHPQAHAGYEPLTLVSESLRQLMASDIEPGPWAEINRRAHGAWRAEPAGVARSLALAGHALETGDFPFAIQEAQRAADMLITEQAFAPATRMLLCCLERSGSDRLDPNLAPLLLRLGECQFRLGRLEHADLTLERAAAHAPADQGDLRLWTLWGEVLDGLGRLEEARERLQHALEPSTPAEPEDRARAYGILGRLEFRLGDARSAAETLQRGLDSLDGRPPCQAAASLGNDLGVLAYHAGRYDEALERHRWTLGVREQLHDRDGIARSLTNLGSVHMSRGQYRAALERYEDSLKLKRKLGNQQSIALTLSNLALLDHWLGRYSSSIERHEESLRIRERSGAIPDQVRSLTHLARVLHEKGAYPRALQCAERALALAAQTGGRDEGFVHAQCARAEILNSLGQVSLAKEAIGEGLRASTALEYSLGCGVLQTLRAEQMAQTELPGDDLPGQIRAELEAALDILRPLGQPHVLAEALLRASTILHDTPGLEMRLDWLAEGGQIAEGLEATALMLRARLLHAHADIAADLPDEASSKLFAVVDGARSLSARDLLWRAYAGLARFHSHYGRSDRVLLWLHRCIATFREVVERMPTEDMQTAYLNAPARRQILDRATSWEEEQED